MGRKKEQEADVEVVPIDFNAKVKAKDLVRVGLCILKHEIDSLAQKAEQNLLGIQEARLLTDYISTAIRISKDITLEEEELSEEQIKTMSPDELMLRARQALKSEGYTTDDLIYDPKGGKKSGNNTSEIP
jgi:hypothetical protein